MQLIFNDKFDFKKKKTNDVKINILSNRLRFN